jgi:outer membrane protein TolC
MDEGPPLSLADAIAEALRNNPTLAALRAQFEAARQRSIQQRFVMAPTFEAQIWQWPINTLNPANTGMYMATVRQELTSRAKRDLRTAVAQKDADLAANDIALQARDVIGQVERAYADLYVGRKAVQIHLASVDLLRQIADASAARYETGGVSQQDTMKAVTEISMRHEDLVMMDEGARVAAAQLNTLLNRQPDAPIGPLAEPRERILLASSADLQRIAIERQPELLGAQLGVERAEAAVAVAARDYKPDLTVGGGYMLMPHDHDAWTATVGINWPGAPWARGALDARKAEAVAEVDAARARRQAVANQVRLAVHEAYIRAQSAQQRAALLRTTLLPQSQQTLELSRVAYQTNRADFSALLDNQRTLLDAQLNYYRALADLDRALADLEHSVGVPLNSAVGDLASREGH